MSSNTVTRSSDHRAVNDTEAPAWVESFKNDIIISLKSELLSITESFKVEMKQHISSVINESEILVLQKVASIEKKVTEQKSITNIVQRKCKETEARLQKLEA